MGKGSKRRPQLVSDETMANNWDKVFSKRTFRPGPYQAFTVLVATNIELNLLCDYKFHNYNRLRRRVITASCREANKHYPRHCAKCQHLNICRSAAKISEIRAIRG